MALPASDCCAIVVLITSCQATELPYKPDFVAITRVWQLLFESDAVFCDDCSAVLLLSSRATRAEQQRRQVQQSKQNSCIEID
jgi:hypothetical protein